MGKTTLATRRFTSRSGAIIDFTELGFGTAPLGNLYRAISEEDAQATLQAGWDARLCNTWARQVWEQSGSSTTMWLN